MWKKTNVLAQALSPDVINTAWKRLQKEHTPWSSSVDRDDLQKDLLKYILMMKQQVEEGNYRPEPLRKFTQPKADGRQRVISAQYLQDKLLQRALLIVLEPKAEQLFHEDSYAYRPHRGVRQAIIKTNERVRCGLDWLVDADIKSFFDNIPLVELKQALSQFIDDRATMQLIDLWLKQGMHHGSFLKAKRGISQGAILSPLMCNLYLHRFDMALAEANIPFVRYADDFLLFTQTKAQAEKAKTFAQAELKKLDLQMHPKKTQVIRSNPNVIFLGKNLPNPKR